MLFYLPLLWAEERVALVIGNGAYKNVSALANPMNDAADIAQTLRALEFEVIERSNLDRKKMAEAIRLFGGKLDNSSVGLFYYAGHGLQVGGQNYLLPLNAPIATADEVPYESISVNRVLAKMETARNGLNIMILDACRNNPFQGRGGFRSVNTGLARINAPTGSLIVYATAPGEKASDGVGRNGLFTKHLLQNMTRPGLDVALMLRDTRAAVMQESQRLGHKPLQVPWESSSLLNAFCFAGCGATKVEPKQAASVPMFLTAEPAKTTAKNNTIGVKKVAGRYIKLNAQGETFVNQSLAYEKQPWFCVKDEQTGLIWEVKTDDDGLHDKDQRFKWAESSAFVQKVNQAGWCAYKDWRIPTREELQSLLLKGKRPAIELKAFPYETGTDVWSSSINQPNTKYVRYVQFKSGSEGVMHKLHGHFALRLVRGGN